MLTTMKSAEWRDHFCRGKPGGWQNQKVMPALDIDCRVAALLAMMFVQVRHRVGQESASVIGRVAAGSRTSMHAFWNMGPVPGFAAIAGWAFWQVPVEQLKMRSRVVQPPYLTTEPAP